MAKEYSLVFRRPGDIGEKRSSPTPPPNVMLKNLEKFCRKWEAVKSLAGTSVLTKEIQKEIRNIKVHIQKGCLSDIPIGCGTNRNERLHRELKKIVATNRIGLPLLYTKLFRMLYRLALENEKEMPCLDQMNAQNIQKLKPKSEDSLEYFGVEKCLDEMERNEDYAKSRKIKGLQNFSHVEINGILDGIVAMQKNIEENWTSSEHDYCLKMDKEQYDLLNHLKEGLSLWRSSECIREIVGMRDNLYGRTLFTDTPISIITTDHLQQETSVETIQQEINVVAAQWGFEVVTMMGDGNCFFSSVAFQVSQLLNRCDLQTHIREHFYSLGILPSLSISEIRNILRRHLVAEWTGPFTEEYQQFVSDDVDFQEQAYGFLTSGTFASSIGDLMPLGLSNVLQVPMLILTTQNLLPFTEIYPRSPVGNGEAILLTYNHAGPGHYDVLIPRTINKQNELQFNEAELQNDAVVETDKQNILEINARKACRCGINAHSNNAARLKKNSYKSRCKCIPEYGECSDKCRCKGQCGENGNCRTMNKNSKEKRTSRKRKKQPIESSPFKTSRVFYEQRTNTKIEEPFNQLEYIILIVIYASLKGMKHDKCGGKSSYAWRIYNRLIELVIQHEFLCNLPLFEKTLEQVQKKIKKWK